MIAWHTFAIQYPIITVLHTAVWAKCIFQFQSDHGVVGNFSSPQFPGNYSEGLECIFNFLGREYETLRLTFYVFDLEPPFKKGCLTDYIDVSTITITHNKFLVGRFCGKHIPPSMLFMNPNAEIIFKTNHVVHHTGFYGRYEFQDEKIIPPPESTQNITRCGGTVSGVGGILMSPGFPEYFPKNVECIWLVRVDYNMRIYVRVLKMQLYGSIANCQEAELAIYDGYSSISFNPQVLQKYCGDLRYYKNVDEQTQLSDRNRLLIRFKTSVSQQAKGEGSAVGFKVTWTAVAFEKEGACTNFVCKESKYCISAAADRSCADTRNYCIDQSLVCNGMPNCGTEDTSDENKCNLPLLAGCAAAGGVTLLSLIVGLLIYKRHNRKSLSNSQSLNIQLRQLEHSPSYAGRPPDGNFYFQPASNCSIHTTSSSRYDAIHQNSLPRADKRSNR